MFETGQSQRRLPSSGRRCAKAARVGGPAKRAARPAGRRTRMKLPAPQDAWDAGKVCSACRTATADYRLPVWLCALVNMVHHSRQDRHGGVGLVAKAEGVGAGQELGGVGEGLPAASIV